VLCVSFVSSNPFVVLNRAKIALDLRDFLNLRGHLDIEHDKALKIYENVSDSIVSLFQLFSVIPMSKNLIS